MEEPKDYFGEKVAATYDGLTGVFEPGAMNATVSLLAELAGGGWAREFVSGPGRGSRSPATAASMSRSGRNRRAEEACMIDFRGDVTSLAARSAILTPA
jgi:hypothetical protein